MTSKDFTGIAKQYAEEVVMGTQDAGQWVKRACERHLYNLSQQENKDYPYCFDVQKATHICRFAELMPHVKGKWAKAIGKDRLLKLEPWQVFILSVLFGWLRKKDQLRRFREAYICVPRKNGKSVLAAVVANYMLAMDREVGSEVYVGASTEKQAFEVFKPAKLMVQRTSAFRRKFGIQVNAKSLEMPRDGGILSPVIGTPGDGSSPHCAIIDEYHEHRTDAMYDTMRTGMGAREQPLLFVITTAGTDISSPCFSHEKAVKNVLAGASEDESLFAVIYSIDEEENWDTKKGVMQANPNYNISVFGDYLLSQVNSAKRSPRKQNIIKQKHFNVWTAGADGWINITEWNNAADDTLDQLDFQDCECWDGLDLASKIDIASRVRIYKRYEADHQDHYYVFGRHYVPESVLSHDDKQHYHDWVDGGYLIATDGNIIDHNQIKDDLLADIEICDFQQLGYDQYNATMLITSIADDVEAIEVPQTTKYLSEPMKWIEALLRDGRLHHDNNPCLNWMVANVTAKEDRNENIFPRKESRDNKIDGAVAMITAMAIVLTMQPEDTDPQIFVF